MKVLSRRVLVVAVGLILVAGFAAAQKRPITEKDLFRFQWIGDPQISPDGSQVAFVRITVDEKKTNYETSIWVASTAGGSVRTLTSGKHDASPRWSPDGKFLAFMRAAEKDGKPQPAQIFILPVTGGEAWPLTKMPKGAGGPEWSPDGKTIAFVSTANPEDIALAACEEKEGKGSPATDKKDQTADAKDQEKDAKDKTAAKCGKPEHEPDIQVVTRVEYRGDNEGYFDFSRPPHIWTIPLPANPSEIGQPTQITKGEFAEDEFEWAADGSKIYFVSTRNLEPYYALPQNAIYSVPSTGGEITEVARIAGTSQAISISPDGSKLAFVGIGNTPVQSSTQPHLWVLDLKAGAKPRNLTAKLDLDIAGGIIGDQEPPRGGNGGRPLWSADGKFLTIVVAKKGRTNLERFDVETGLSTPVTQGDQAVTQYTSNGKQTVAEISTPTIINDLYLVGSDPAQSKRLTDVNEKLFAELNLTAPEEITYTSFDGKKIQGFVQKPPDFDPKKQYPLILNIHGGPHTAYGYVFFHEMQWMAAKGYVVLYPNPRGSTSFGEEFANIIQYKYPGDDYHDLMAGVDDVIQRGYVDAKRLGVTGGSGGGLLTNWVIGHTDRFAAAVAQRDIASWTAWWYSDDFALFRPMWFHKPPFEEPADYRDRSPISFVNFVKTPLMLILGDADLRTPPSAGGEQMFRALKYRKVPTVMVRFPAEGHELSRSGQPWHRIERLHHIVNWFDIYLQGKKTNEYDLVPPVEPGWEKSAER
jgi:dipeptidyl aminopeptidase/acylaminoacyl peptidase